jgi:hypothetical protein
LEKKSWTKPQLIVLVRTRPEEALILNCKGNAPQSPFLDDSNCNGDGSGRCIVCETIGQS